ncbi:hypothetical protein FB468_2132 [Leucobacter komagatae]|uniref:Uncharacterized protein n=1 Tax=Leucobacter komagatae TaxID=55969 RepID=A0A542Y7K9_9MICO|nr:hypothetical protein [Leucobacter komagatae]TQL44088.1 hypothetical protein FB468_2132 [Leucobacter komagatae]
MPRPSTRLLQVAGVLGVALIAFSPVTTLLELSGIARGGQYYSVLMPTLGATIVFAACGTALLTWVFARVFDDPAKQSAVALVLMRAALSFGCVLGAVAWVWALLAQQRVFPGLPGGDAIPRSWFPAVPIIWALMYLPLIAPTVDTIILKRRPGRRYVPVASVAWTGFLVALFVASGTLG